MGLTPVEIRHIKLGHAVFGYKRSVTDELLEDVAESFEDVWRDRADLADRVEHLESELVRYRELEALLRATLVSAERAASELKEQARREAELIVSDAQSESRSITRRARAESEYLEAETRRLRSILHSTLATLEDGEPHAEAA